MCSNKKMKDTPPRVIGGHCSEILKVKKARGHHSYAVLSQSTQVPIGSEHIFDKISDSNVYSDHVLQNGPREMLLLMKTRQDTICWWWFTKYQHKLCNNKRARIWACRIKGPHCVREFAWTTEINPWAEIIQTCAICVFACLGILCSRNTSFFFALRAARYDIYYSI